MSTPTDLTNESLSPGPDTFTLERIQKVLRDDMLKIDSESPERGIPPPFNAEYFYYSLKGRTHRFYTDSEQNERRESFCRELYAQVSDCESHCLRLDDRFSQIISCNFRTEKIDDISDFAYRLLTRFPARPFHLLDVPPALSPDYLVHSPPVPVEGDSTATITLWRNLKVTSYISTNVIRTALVVAIDRVSAYQSLPMFLNSIADLISTTSRLSLSADSELTRQSWFIVRAFLWTSWQRCTMIYFYSLFAGSLSSGFDDEIGTDLVLHGMQVSPGLSIQEMSRGYARLNKPRYMCGWAFELLRTDPICIGLDFRRFFYRYSIAFGDRPGRCLSGGASCKGDEPGKCQRFRGMRIENQSFHDDKCQGDCGRLIWNEESYRSVSGARAVTLEISGSRKELIYRRASADTLAISHVWSHGQGGRPEAGHGFNYCLHRRYISIARSLGCNSYWMDTPCIPEDHKLRHEAIENINLVFEQSRATVICDRDLMDIDASNLSVKVHELILVTIMVCDWNLRAWTFLEAIRGRESIYILCRDNVMIPLRETVEIVSRQGSIEIALLLLSIPHLLPARNKLKSRSLRSVGKKSYENGFLTIGTAGRLLSHREASRPGDDIVIWSLLLGDTVNKKAKAFWKSRQGQTLGTSFLLSSTPRLKKKGLGWAPRSPTAQLVQMRANGPQTQTRLLGFDGQDSDPGIIRKDGFLANWYMYDFIRPYIGVKRLSSWLDIDLEPEDESCADNLHEIRRRFLRGYLWGAILRPWSKRTDEPAPDRGDTNTTLVVVCATNRRFRCPGETDVMIRWQWRGVYEWNMAEPLPKFVLVHDLLLV